MADKPMIQVSGGNEVNPHVIYFETHPDQLPSPPLVNLTNFHEALIRVFRSHSRSRVISTEIRDLIFNTLEGVPLTENQLSHWTGPVGACVRELQLIFDQQILPQLTVDYLEDIDLLVTDWIRRCVECILNISSIEQRWKLISAFLKGEKIEQLRQIYFNEEFTENFVNIQMCDGINVDEEDLEAIQIFLQEILKHVSITPWFNLDQLLTLYEENVESVEPISVNMTISLRGKPEASSQPVISPEILTERLIDLGINIQDDASGLYHPFYRGEGEEDGAEMMVGRLVKALVAKYESGTNAADSVLPSLTEDLSITLNTEMSEMEYPAEIYDYDVDEIGRGHMTPEQEVEVRTAGPVPTLSILQQVDSSTQVSAEDLSLEELIPSRPATRTEDIRYGPPSESRTASLIERAKSNVLTDKACPSASPTATELDYLIVRMLKDEDDTKLRMAYLEKEIDDAEVDVSTYKNTRRETEKLSKRKIAETGDTLAQLADDLCDSYVNSHLSYEEKAEKVREKTSEIAYLSKQLRYLAGQLEPSLIQSTCESTTRYGNEPRGSEEQEESDYNATIGNVQPVQPSE